VWNQRNPEDTVTVPQSAALIHANHIASRWTWEQEEEEVQELPEEATHSQRDDSKPKPKPKPKTKPKPKSQTKTKAPVKETSATSKKIAPVADLKRKNEVIVLDSLDDGESIIEIEAIDVEDDPYIAKQKPSTKVRKIVKKESLEFDVNDFEGCAPGLWETEKTPASLPLPRKLQGLDVFAGCGGLCMSGSARYGEKDSIAIETIAAVEIEKNPALTYKKNYPSVNVMQIGISRFLASGRRIWKLKTGALDSTGPLQEVIGVKIATDVAQEISEDAKEKKKKRASTEDKQFKDDVTVEELSGNTPLPWLRFQVRNTQGETQWVPENRIRNPDSIQAYLNSDKFSAHDFPLPGDIHVLTGGPPCQGWSGFNTQRLTCADMAMLLKHPENSLLVRFLEVVWFYRPLYVAMEEVPDVGKENVMSWMKMVYETKGYSLVYEQRLHTGCYGVPQTRPRLICLATLAGLPTVEMPEPEHAKYETDEDAIISAFEGSEAAYPCPLRRDKLYKTSGDMASANKSKTAAIFLTKDGQVPDLRFMVRGDSLSADLPRDAHLFKGNKDEAIEAEGAVTQYLCDPPTPYVAFLRQGCGQDVKNHLVYELGLSDRLRVKCVPCRKGAGWRDMAGDKHVASLLQPMMMDVSDEEGKHVITSRFYNSVPEYMRVTPKNQSSLPKNEPPPLKHGWKLKPDRFPLIPFWCLSMSYGKDHNCYGRMWHDEPSPTIHSYHKPHWHRQLVPFAHRVISVRDGARLQGFPDHFEFCGSVGSMYSQIGNAVSPQLAKAIARSIFDSHSSALKLKKKPVYDMKLQSFAEFFKGFDESTLAKVDRLGPIPTERPTLSPMSYEEMCIEYNTQYRSDHSTKFKDWEIFPLLKHVDGYRNWANQAMSGIRNSQGSITPSPFPLTQILARIPALTPHPYIKGFLEIAVQYHGWPEPIWLDVSNQLKSYLAMRTFQEFLLKGGVEVQKILAGKKKGAFCLPGCRLDGPFYSEELSTYAPLALQDATAYIDECDERYKRDRKLDRMYGGKRLKSYGRIEYHDENDEDVDATDSACETEEETEPSQGKKRRAGPCKDTNSDKKITTSKRSKTSAPQTKSAKSSSKNGSKHPESPARWREMGGAGKEEDRLTGIRLNELKGAFVSCWWDQHEGGSWCPGVIIKANGVKIVVRYDDDPVGDYDEDIELPEDTCRIVKYPGDPTPVSTPLKLPASSSKTTEALEASNVTVQHRAVALQKAAAPKAKAPKAKAPKARASKAVKQVNEIKAVEEVFSDSDTESEEVEEVEVVEVLEVLEEVIEKPKTTEEKMRADYVKANTAGKRSLLKKWLKEDIITQNVYDSMYGKIAAAACM